MDARHLIRVGTWAMGLVLGLPALAGAQFGGIDLQRSEYRRWNELPRRGEADPKPWVGYWWAYTSNGMANRYRGEDEKSPAEKYDEAVGRADRVDLDAVRAHVEALRDRVHPLQNERRDLVRDLNRRIARGEDYRDCSEYPDDAGCREDAERDCQCPWNRYWELQSLIEQARAEAPRVTVDTMTEFEHLEHGNGVAGVEGWWGHCNAWAAAAILEPEPVREGEVGGVRFRVGDAKALLTEGYMDVRSAFYGTRVYDDEPSLPSDQKALVREKVAQGERDRAILDALQEAFPEGDRRAQEEYIEWFRAWNDVTPADFHILFSVYLGQMRRAFVIDRYTTSQVWNQPVTAFESRVVREMEPTEDGRYPILVETTFEWASDGVDPDATNESIGASGFHDRTLTYTLYLDKPSSDPDARIVGPGKWEHAAAAGSHAHPDFIWMPTGDQRPTPRADGSYYENPHLDMDWVRRELLPRVTAPVGGDVAGDEGSGPSEVSASAAPGAAIADFETVESRLALEAEGDALAVSVEVEIRHSYIGDLEVSLEHAGRKVLLHNRTGGGRNDLRAVFDPSEFRGLPAGGEWTLRVRDAARGDVGELVRWSLSVVVGEASNEGTGGATEPADAPPSFEANGVPAEIPDNRPNEPAVVTFEVPAEADFEVDRAVLEVEIRHTYTGDLRLVLKHEGVEVVVYDREDGSADDIVRSFELRRFRGHRASGTWTLEVSDHARIDTGRIEAATLSLPPRN